MVVKLFIWMRVKILGSNSIGNCYVFFGINSNIIIELGISRKDVIKAIGGTEFKKIAFGLVTHHHQDHCKNIREFKIDKYTNKVSAPYIRAKSLSEFKKYTIGEWEFKCFPVYHSITNIGYWIRNTFLNETYLFATDFYKCSYLFDNITHYFVEANYQANMLFENSKNGILGTYDPINIVNAHMEIINLVNWLKTHKMDRCKSITLIHLSQKNADKNLFEYIAKSAFNLPVFIAENGTEIMYKEGIK